MNAAITSVSRNCRARKPTPPACVTTQVVTLPA